MPSENVQKLKNLIIEGYKIHSISLSVKNQVEKVEILLVHGKEKKIMAVENDDEFTNFSFHFKPFEDSYGNPIFRYVEDLDAYNKEVEKQSKMGKPPKKNYETSIGGRKLIEPFLFHLIKAGPGQPLGEANFDIKISKNNHFKDLDFRDPAIVKDFDLSEVVFTGQVHKVLYDADTARFICRGGPASLHIQKLKVEFINFSRVEALNFLTESAGIKSNFHSGPKPNFKKRLFTIICPLLNLKIPNTFTIGDVTFYYSEHNDDDKIIESSDTCKRNAKWDKNNVRAKTVVEATSFIKAIQIGYRKISQIVDWIRLRVDISFPYYQRNTHINPLSFNFQKQYSRFELTTQIYCRENNTKNACIYDLNVKIGHPLVFQYDPEEYFAGIYKKFKHMLSKSQQEMSKEELRIVSSLHWLSLAINSNKSLDKLLYLWTALEFILSESKLEKKFNGRDREEIRGKIMELNLNNEQLKIIKAKIEQLNDPPLMVTIQNELDKNKIKLERDELEVLKKMRKLRNDVIHGKASGEIGDEDIEKFISIVERLLVSIVDVPLESPTTMP